MFRRLTPRLMLPSESFAQFVKLGTLRDDHRQQEALTHLDRVYNDLLAITTSTGATPPRDLTVPAPIRRGYTSLAYLKADAAKTFLKEQGALERVHPLSKVRGLYLYGGVGCGKTQLMDILYNEAPVAKKQRVHFHQFMLDVHKMQHKIKQSHSTGSVDGNMIMQELAVKICHNAELLCFDELIVADIVDAMILKRLFHALYSVGICCVFTSNRPPPDLYMNGLNRESFLPFIRMLTERCHVHNMESDTDYRLTGRQAQTYFAPFDGPNFEKFNQLFLDITHQRIAGERVLRVFGRDVIAPRAVGQVAYFTFHELCIEDLSAADYGVIAKVFHTVFIEGVPRFGPQDSNSRRRFIALIDELYQARVKVLILAEEKLELLTASDEHVQLIKSSEADAASRSLETGSQINADVVLRESEETLYAGKLIDTGEDSFQMKRCVSRLQEMRTHEYLESKFQGSGDVSLLDGAPGH